jgi:hypothetical protein
MRLKIMSLFALVLIAYGIPCSLQGYDSLSRTAHTKYLLYEIIEDNKKIDAALQKREKLHSLYKVARIMKDIDTMKRSRDLKLYALRQLRRPSLNKK